MEPVLRLATHSDLLLLRQMADEYYRYDQLDISPVTATAALEELLQTPDRGQVWVIHDGDAAAGYVVLAYGFSVEFGGRDAFIDELYLREEYRGRGWGRLVMRFVERAAAEAGVRALHLEVTRGNARALALYTSLGYVDHDRFLMTKPLRG